MKRTALLIGLVALLLSPWFVQAQNPAQRVIIMDPTGTHAASVSGGNLGTTASVGDVTVESIDTLGHITSAVHVAGIAQTVLVNCVTGCSASGSTHTAVTQAAQPWTIQHITSAVHVVVSGRPGVAAHQAGTWAVTSSGTAAVDQSGTWNIAAAHIVGGSGHLAITFAGGGHVAITQGAAALQVDCSNCSAATAVNVGHISSAVHVAAIAQPVHVVGVSIVNAAYPLTCHSSMAFHTSALATTLAHANSGMKIYICGLLLIMQAADQVSIVEGQGTACATGRRELIGHTTAALSLPATGGFSTVHPFPWINSKTTGNAVCLVKGNAQAHVSGVITYRGAP